VAVKTELDIALNEDGTVELKVKGAKGKKCRELTKWLEEELGIVTKREHTGEYYEEQVHETNEIKVGE
jgi:hypothetical protein